MIKGQEAKESINSENAKMANQFSDQQSNKVYLVRWKSNSEEIERINDDIAEEIALLRRIRAIRQRKKKNDHGHE